jgi:hypothetical protein
LKRRVGRFEIYSLLEAVYRVYVDWKRRKRARLLLADPGDIAIDDIKVFIERAYGWAAPCP